ncbi:MAG: ATPase domain-containing protein, partial [Planctomycetota bacterium]
MAEVITTAAKPGRFLSSAGPPERLDSIDTRNLTRTPTGVKELDRVLGGGLVAGQTVLVGGEPGIGKSTLLLQVLSAQAAQGRVVLYISGEESRHQVKLRAERLGVGAGDLFVHAESDLDGVRNAIEELSPETTVIDSIQMMAMTEVSGAPGGVSQVRECGAELVSLAKSRGGAILLVGHVTKDGSLAGPRTLEHMVDTVLYFEGDRFQSLRLIRAMKNRFGPTLEVGVFEMTEKGLSGLED